MGIVFEFTDHALEQFITRYDRSLTKEEARQRLIFHTANHCRRLSEKSYTGQYQWHLTQLNTVLITKARKRRQVVVTIIDARHIVSIQRQEDLNRFLKEADEAQAPVLDALHYNENGDRIYRLDLRVNLRFSLKDETAVEATEESIVQAFNKILTKGFFLKNGALESVEVKKQE